MVHTTRFTNTIEHHLHSVQTVGNAVNLLLILNLEVSNGLVRVSVSEVLLKRCTVRVVTEVKITIMYINCACLARCCCLETYQVAVNSHHIVTHCLPHV
ncbi:MAG: hypothetical protein [Caudoviricetes sp.]|nr:MAG: hypothetical protein [Caudoviricetes sp.]